VRVVADTGPINYLVQIEAIELLPQLFGTILIPTAVRNELAHERAPPVVRDWIAQAPSWIEVKPDANLFAVSSALDEGERAAIALAASIDADLILIDDREAGAVARAQGFAVTGTLGVLDLAARRRLVDLVAAFTRLKGTTFYYRQGLLEALLAQHSEEKR
jgi:predicted nucleic acid-binding protein